MDLLFSVMQKTEKLNQVPKTHHEARRQILTQEFFNKAYERVSKGYLLAHQPLFALRLV